MKKILGIIQARMGSERLPGKMLLNLGENQIVEWVIKRSSQSQFISKLIMATTVNKIDDELIKKCKEFNLEFFRGSENDVLGRFYNAAKEFNADIVVRICADNPFIDPIEIDRLITFYVNNECDYSCNHQNKLGSNYADGFGAEIFNMELLNFLNTNCENKEHREHVTLYLWDNQGKFKIKIFNAPKSLSFPNFIFDINNRMDFEKLSELVREGVKIDSEASDIINIYKNILAKK